MAKQSVCEWLGNEPVGRERRVVTRRRVLLDTAAGSISVIVFEVRQSDKALCGDLLVKEVARASVQYGRTHDVGAMPIVE